MLVWDKAGLTVNYYEFMEQVINITQMKEELIAKQTPMHKILQKIRKELIRAMIEGNCVAFDFKDSQQDFIKEFTDKKYFDSKNIFDWKYLHEDANLKKFITPEEMPF